MWTVASAIVPNVVVGHGMVGILRYLFYRSHQFPMVRFGEGAVMNTVQYESGVSDPLNDYFAGAKNESVFNKIDFSISSEVDLGTLWMCFQPKCVALKHSVFECDCEFASRKLSGIEYGSVKTEDFEETVVGVYPCSDERIGWFGLFLAG